MIVELANKNIVFLLGLLILWVGGMALSSVGSVTTFGYDMREGYEYICSGCGKLIPKKHYHTREECLDCSEWNKRGLPCQPDHRCYYGSEQYVRSPDWKIFPIKKYNGCV